MDTTIPLNETVEKKCVALFHQCGGKTYKQHVLQYYRKKTKTKQKNPPKPKKQTHSTLWTLTEIHILREKETWKVFSN